MVCLRFLVPILIIIKLSMAYAETEKPKSPETISSNCPYPKLPEEIFKVHNKSKVGILEDNEKKLLNLTEKVNDMAKQNDQVNSIIASINRIKKNMTNSKYTNNDEAIILNYPKTTESPQNFSNVESKPKNPFIKVSSNLSGPYRERPTEKRETTTDKTTTTTTAKSTFVEILTIEPNNTNKFNSSAHNIIEILKHLMPMFNSTLTKELHNLTVIERDNTSNHSFSAVKNISTIIVTYCDTENYTKANITEMKPDTVIKLPDYINSNDKSDVNETYFDEDDGNITIDERRDILEAADFGMQKMHELYTVTEPKLYSMGYWLDDGNPARYVAAFNAPTEDMARYSRYGYASLQAATKLKELVGEDGLERRTEDGHFPTAGALRQSALLQHCPIRGVPKCPPASKRYRTHDGTCNNFNRPRWGSTMTPVQRFQPPVYSDGIQAPRRSILGPILPSAREISSTIHEDQNIETPTITHLLMQWGQFLDHDVTSSSQSRGFNGSVPRCCKDGGRDFVPKDLMHPECMPIPVPASDPFYGPRGVRCLDFVRSSPAPHDDCSLGWREQLNQVSAYIDASPLYGSSAAKSDKLRLFRNGMLQYGRVQQRRPILPPERKDELCRGGAVSSDCFKSGDARVNEHPGLVAAHIVWLRQHNRMAQELAHLNPHWSDEKIYQETRKIVGAMVQHITYKEFLPIVLGSEVMRIFDLEPRKKGFYRNYDPKVNPSPASSFGSAAFRFGHSLVQPSMMRYDRFHRPMDNNVSLHEELSNPSNIWSMGAVDRLLLGMVNQPIQKRDEFITEELTNHLFQTPKFSFGMDLAAINVQRGRDHGVPPYTSWREPCGLTAIKEFEDLFRVMPARTVRKLQTLYRHIDDIDLFTGGMAERPVVGGLVGPTFACIIAQQFSNLRKGDRFWYENRGFESSFTPAQLQQIRRITFAQVLCRTLDTIDSIQPFAFLSSENSNNQRLSCTNSHLNNFDLSPWTEIDSNDIGKDIDDELTSERPTTTTSTTEKVSTTTETETTTIKKDKLRPLQSFFNTMNNIPILNLMKISMGNDSDKNKSDLTNKTLNRIKSNMTVQRIDDKLDFKNKIRRDDNDEFRHNEPTDIRERYDYEYDEDNVQSVQSVVINNHKTHKRPTSQKRPVIAVTENTDKFTYLINYVPKQTSPWRQTTRRPYHDRDVVKITYQNYDDTYRRPYKPYYYNRQDDITNEYNYRRDRPDRQTTKKNELQSSARSNDDDDLTLENNDKRNPTTENGKLVTFGYVGTYKGDDKTKSDLRLDSSDLSRQEPLSKDFSTYDKLQQTDNSMKLSTFFTLETATKPYLSYRPTRRHDDDQTPKSFDPDSKYYYVKNVLHKYPDFEMTLTEKPLIVEERRPDFDEETNSNFRNYNIEITETHNDKRHDLEIDERDVNVEKRTADMTIEQDSFKTAQRNKLGIKNRRPPSSAAKTPSVAFQVIPSENSPSLWAVYEENADLPDGLPDPMPAVSHDPLASKEIPKPLNLTLRKLTRRYGRK